MKRNKLRVIKNKLSGEVLRIEQHGNREGATHFKAIVRATFGDNKKVTLFTGPRKYHWVVEEREDDTSTEGD